MLSTRQIVSRKAIFIVVFFLFYITSLCKGAKWSELCKCEELSFCRKNRVTDQTEVTRNLLFPTTRVRSDSVKAKKVFVGNVPGEILQATLDTTIGNVSSVLDLQIFPLIGKFFPRGLRDLTFYRRKFQVNSQRKRRTSFAF
jgi:hypothetical protein